MNEQHESAQTAARYDAWHALRGVDADADAPWHQMMKARLVPERDLTERRLLEIGCGRGGFACWLAGGAHPPSEIVAADFSQSAIAKAEEILPVLDRWAKLIPQLK